MPFFTASALRERHRRSYTALQKSASIQLREAASEYGPFTFFLSHSFTDAAIIAPLRDELQDLGYRVYVDWLEDTKLDRAKVNKHTASVLRDRMKRSKALIYAFSPGASLSRWMPWEAGYFDALKGRVAILPIFETDPGGESYTGQEYLSLYPYMVKGTRELWVHASASSFVLVSEWLAGKNPL